MLKLRCLDNLVNRLRDLFAFHTFPHTFLHQFHFLALLSIFQIVLHSLLENIGPDVGLFTGLFGDNKQAFLVLEPEHMG